MRTSILDGLFAVQYTTLTAGALLAAFLLALGASEVQIGLVAALPLLGGLLQPLGAEVIRRRGGWRKPVALAAALLDDLLWGVVLAAVLWLDPPRALTVVIGVLALQQGVNAFVSVAWTSWISDLVPAVLRGRFFGRRNFTCNALGALTAILAGQVVHLSGLPVLHAFLWMIGAGMLFRLASITFLSRQPEFHPATNAPGTFFRQLATPLADTDFRKFLTYGIAWGFSVQLAAPFFNVYMLRELAVGVDTVMLFAGLGTISNLVGQRLWGDLADRYGDYQVMRTTGLAVALQPLWWILTGADGPGFYLMGFLSITGGFAWSGHLLATGNMMMRLAPETGKTSFFAMQAALGGLFGALGPFVGGLIAGWLTGGGTLLPGPLFVGLKSLFILSFLLRLGAWGLFHRIPQPAQKPRLRTIYILRDAARTFNPTQGFSPLLHVFTVIAERSRPHHPVRSRRS